MRRFIHPEKDYFPPESGLICSNFPVSFRFHSKRSVLRVLLTILTLSFGLSFAVAQPDFKRELNIGLSQGAVISRMVFDPYVSQKLYQGYNGGLIIRYISEPLLGLQLEFNYMQRGWKEETRTLGIYRRDQEILAVPLMTHLYFGRKTRMRFQVVLGPYAAYLLNDVETIRVPDINEYNDYYGKAAARKVEFGYSGGIAAALRTRAGIFELDLRYNHCLTNLFKPGDEEFIYLGSRPHSLGVSLHYLVMIKGK